ncbi:MAG: hypothetical protein IMZ69_03155 [Spirochaetes bacterium]|nr:hypothetical protein [Spirochaetota bacterium]
MMRKSAARPFADEYVKAVGHPIQTLWLDPFRQLVSVEYVAWLEAELTRARENAGGKR